MCGGASKHGTTAAMTSVSWLWGWFLQLPNGASVMSIASGAHFGFGAIEVQYEVVPRIADGMPCAGSACRTASSARMEQTAMT